MCTSDINYPFFLHASCAFLHVAALLGCGLGGGEGIGKGVGAWGCKGGFKGAREGGFQVLEMVVERVVGVSWEVSYLLCTSEMQHSLLHVCIWSRADTCVGARLLEMQCVAWAHVVT